MDSERELEPDCVSDVECISEPEYESDASSEPDRFSDTDLTQVQEPTITDYHKPSPTPSDELRRRMRNCVCIII